MIGRRLKEYDLEEPPTLHEIKPKDRVTLGCFTVEFIHVTHSTVDTVALAIETPAGSGHPYRRLQNRPDADRQQAVRPAHLRRLRQARRAAADVGLDQCRPRRLYAFRARRSAGVSKISSRARKGGCSSPAFPRRRTAFSRSSTCRSQHGRRVAMIGRSLITASELAHELGLLNVPDGTLHPAAGSRPHAAHPTAR